MYIPDSIRIVGRAQSVVVYSADEGHDHDEPLQVARVRIEYDEFQGLSARVDYGTNLKRFGIDDPYESIVSRDYLANRVTFDDRGKQAGGQDDGRGCYPAEDV